MTREPTPTELTAWHEALALWGVDLHDPVIDVHPTGDTFAWFTFPPEVHVDPAMAERLGGPGHLATVFAHEIGHHVLSPSTRLMSLKIRHQMARAMFATSPALSGRPKWAAMLSNLWSDLIVNVRIAHLQRVQSPTTEPGMVTFMRALSSGQLTMDAADRSPMWWVINRAYEQLWSLPPGSLCHRQPPEAWRTRLQHDVERARAEASVPPDRIKVDVERRHREKEQKLQAAQRARSLAEAEAHPALQADPVNDAAALADTVRTLAADPIRGALPCGMLLARYLVLDIGTDPGQFSLNGCAESDSGPPTPGELTTVLGDARLSETPRHPVDARLDELGAEADQTSEEGSGQALGIAETLNLYQDADPHAVMAAWYQNQARPYVAPLTQRGAGSTGETIPGPLATWDINDELADLDWPATLGTSPIVIPGVTTRQRTQQEDEPQREQIPVTLDLYLDSSGSMPRPERGSPAVLAGTILSLSVLRAGGRMRVTSWSGPGQVASDTTFTRDPVETMRQLTTFFGGGTTFPLDLLAARYLTGRHSQRDGTRHLVVLSDDGLTSMFGDHQEQFAEVAARVRAVVDTATLIVEDRSHRVDDIATQAGYAVLHIASMTDAPAACAELAAQIARYEPVEVTR